MTEEAPRALAQSGESGADPSEGGRGTGDEKEKLSEDQKPSEDEKEDRKEDPGTTDDTEGGSKDKGDTGGSGDER